MSILFTRITWLLVTAAFATRAWAEQHPIQLALDDGQFERASKLVEKISDEDRDAWLGKLALAQLETGQSNEARQTLRRIHSSSQLTNTAASIAHQAQGGGTGADFDSLINLITSTVEPDSWDEVGGPGTVLSFPGGVAVNAAGVVSKLKSKRQSRSFEIIRDVSVNNVENSTGDVDIHRSSKLRMVSLPRLERELKIRLAMGEKPTDAMTHLAGLFEIQYLFIFPKTRDVVIAGPADSWRADESGRDVTPTGRPVLLLDDLVSVMRNAREKRGVFGCSIDPKRERLAATRAFLARPTGVLKPSQTRRWVHGIRDTLGLQNIRVYGLEPSCHAARLIVEADYHMKLVGMGLEPSVDGLDSYLDSIDAQSLPKEMDVLRWWFTLRPEGLTKSHDGQSFEFVSSVVALKSDNEVVAKNGQRQVAASTTELNQQFANRFTQHFGQLRREYPLYDQLENLFRMAVVAGVLQSNDIQSSLQWNENWFSTILQPSQGIAPAEVASIVNHRVINRKHVVVGVSGGVTINVNQNLGRVKLAKDESRLTSSKQLANRKLPRNSEQWWWDR